MKQHEQKIDEQLKTRKNSDCWTPFPRISGIQIMPRQKVNERGKKTVVTDIILYKRKGGIRLHKAIEGLYKAIEGPYKAL